MLHELDDEWKRKRTIPSYISLKTCCPLKLCTGLKGLCLELERFFVPLLPRWASVGRGRKDARDMLRSVHWDEQSLFNLMFVRTSIIFIGCVGRRGSSEEDVRGRWRKWKMCYLHLEDERIVLVNRGACQSVKNSFWEPPTIHFDNSFHCTVWFQVANWFLVKLADGKHGTRGEKAPSRLKHDEL